MPNAVFDIVVSILELHVGDILATGVTKKALTKVGASENSVTITQMQMALRQHIGPVLTSFMTMEKSKNLVRSIEKRMREAS
ncbi:MAG: hypothetical protein KAT70_00625 [Thermoplasmata archaeon]|nr:hypothetical protein [Thermoplasmata archaeon]